MSQICWQSFGSGHTSGGWHQLNASHRIALVGNRTEGIGELRTRPGAAETLLHGERLWESIPLDKTTYVTTCHKLYSTLLDIMVIYHDVKSCMYICISRLVMIHALGFSSFVSPEHHLPPRREVQRVVWRVAAASHGGPPSCETTHLARGVSRGKLCQDSTNQAAFCSAFSNISDDAWGSR